MIVLAEKNLNVTGKDVHFKQLINLMKYSVNAHDKKY